MGLGTTRLKSSQIEQAREPVCLFYKKSVHFTHIRILKSIKNNNINVYLNWLNQ